MVLDAPILLAALTISHIFGSERSIAQRTQTSEGEVG